MRRLQKSGREPWPSQGLIHAPLALAYHAAGRATEAKLALARADAAVQEMADAMLRGKSAQQQIPWFDFIELLQIHREAHLAITGTQPGDPEQLAQLRRQSMQLLDE